MISKVESVNTIWITTQCVHLKFISGILTFDSLLFLNATKMFIFPAWMSFWGDWKVWMLDGKIPFELFRFYFEVYSNLFNNEPNSLCWLMALLLCLYLLLRWWINNSSNLQWWMVLQISWYKWYKFTWQSSWNIFPGKAHLSLRVGKLTPLLDTRALLCFTFWYKCLELICRVRKCVQMILLYKLDIRDQIFN